MNKTEKSGIKERFKLWRERQYIKTIKYLINLVNSKEVKLQLKELDEWEIDRNKRKSYFKVFGDIESTGQIKLDKEVIGEKWGKDESEYIRHHNMTCYKEELSKK